MRGVWLGQWCLMIFFALATPSWAGPASSRHLAPGDISVSGLVPPLKFTMRDAVTGRLVTQQDFPGKVVMLYFGYTNCPDVCPDTLYKVQRLFSFLQADAKNIVFLFVTVDPNRDTLPILKQYLELFDPHFVGLRGNADQLYRLARRYRVVFAVHPSPDPEKYAVVHSALIYVFTPQGNADFAISDLSLSQHPDFQGISADLRHAMHAKPDQGVLSWLTRLD
jgi:protein SCO1/2